MKRRRPGALASLGPLALVIALALLPAACGPEPDPARSPYAGEESREIKALDSAEVAGLLAGEGLGYARAAELNGLPGPRHVLDDAAELELDDDQRARIQAIFDAMSAEAVRLGATIVERERELDRLMAGGAPTPGAVAERTLALGRLEGELRNVHLQAHLATTPILTPHQRTRYREIRGYAAAGEESGHGDHTGH